MLKSDIQNNTVSKFGILFDLDGVIIDSEKEYSRIWNLINNLFPTGTEDFARKIKGTNLEDILSRHYPEPSIREKVEEKLYEEEGKMKYYYCPGAEDVLKKLKSLDVPMALYTSSNKLKMEHLYKDIPDIPKYFDFIVLGDMVNESKPSPEGYLKAAEGLGLEPGNWIVVEDSLQGVIAGKASGGKVIGVSGTLPSSTLEPHCDKVIDSMEQFPFEMIPETYLHSPQN